MILRWLLDKILNVPEICPEGSKDHQVTYQRFVNTTPKPRATKNNNGELLALFEPDPSPLAVVVAALLEAEVVVGDISSARNR